jgi:hypothetical protein
MLPHPLTHLSGFASLNKAYLAPHDTIHTILQAGPGIKGTADLTWAHPTKSRPSSDGFIISGSRGWVSVNQISKMIGPDPFPVIRVAIHSVSEAEDGSENEKEEIIEEKSIGVKAELGSFFSAVRGQDDGKGLGKPLAALGDVAFIQAALNSNGSLIDLNKLMRV